LENEDSVKETFYTTFTVFIKIQNLKIMNQKETFQDIIDGDTPVLVDFFATWCGPCKTMSPILEAFSKQMGDRVRVIKIDVDKATTTAATYKIQSVPTLILFQKGEILWRASGVVQKQQLENIIKELTVKAY
jgi:thioredoxin 1